MRTPFQRDRDRIVHSKPFRRLKGKTQVFIDPAGDHYRTRMTHTLETTGDRARRRPGAAAERGSRRGDRARPRHRPSAVRPRRRGGARRGAARAVRRRLPPQRAVAPDRRGAEPHRRGARRHPHAHGPAGAGDARGQDRADRRPRRLHQPRHRRRRSATASSTAGDLPRDEIELLGRHGRPADRHARPRPRRDLGATRATSARATRSARRCSRCARSCSSASISAPGRAPRARARARTVVRRIFDHARRARRREPTTITDFIAGMTDRFALDYAERLG